ncbi:DUF433 domain-containing protein [Brevundimonas sp.]
MLAGGAMPEEILSDFTYLDADDSHAALAYATANSGAGSGSGAAALGVC